MSEWAAYDLYISPLPDPAWIGASVQNTFCHVMDGKAKCKIEDFIPVIRKKPKPDPRRDMAILDSMVARDKARKTKAAAPKSAPKTKAVKKKT